MSKTVLAVDDSATMRSVLEITFAGESFKVLTADTAANAVAKMREEPAAVVIDTSLGTDDGYALAKDLRSRDAKLAVILMASRHNPYDAGRGKDAGADDYIDKPFDTQALIDKVKKAIQARESGASVAAPIPAPAFTPAAPAASPAAPAVAAAHRVPMPAIPGVPGAVARPAVAAQRTATLAFEGPPLPMPPAAAQPAKGPSVTAAVPQVSRPAQPAAPAPAAPVPLAPPLGAAPAATAPTAAAAATAANGQLSGKLADIGLTPVQIEAVLALSREVVERVVWEVVPVLAETIIQEEIARLTRE